MGQEKKRQPMKVVLVNSFYSNSKPSGENEIFKELFNGLKKFGIWVSSITLETDMEEKKFLFRSRAAFNVFIGKGMANPSKQIEKLNPDIVHINNLFPNFESNWLKKTNYPKVITIHNYRAICAAGTLSRDGKFCNLCLYKPYSAIRYRCYKNSKLATLPLYISRLLKRQEKILTKFQKVFVPSQRALDIFSTFGIANEKWQVIPHAIQQPKLLKHEKINKYVFVGRLSPEKGIERILDMWPQKVALDVIGDGNLDRSKYISNVNVNFLGKVSRKEVLELLPKYKGMVFTSSSPESALPLVVLESIALGLPIITTDNNTVSDAVREGNFGAILPANYIKRDLEFCIKQIESNYEDLRIKAQNYSKLHHNFRSWINAYNSIYKQVIEEWENNRYIRELQ